MIGAWSSGFLARSRRGEAHRGQKDATTQDFIMINAPIFFVRQSEGLRASGCRSGARQTRGVLCWSPLEMEAVKIVRGQRLFNPIQVRYWSMTAILYWVMPPSSSRPLPVSRMRQCPAGSSRVADIICSARRWPSSSRRKMSITSSASRCKQIPRRCRSKTQWSCGMSSRHRFSALPSFVYPSRTFPLPAEARLPKGCHTLPGMLCQSIALSGRATAPG